MDLGEQILRFYLKVFSLLLILVFYFVYVFFIKEIQIENNVFIIKKNDNYINFINNNIIDSNLNKYSYRIILKLLLKNNFRVHFGKFEIPNNSNFLQILKIINSPSKYYEKITIIEGESEYELNSHLNKYFNNFPKIKYSDVIADTYFISYGSTFKDFKDLLDTRYLKLKNKYKNNILLKKFSFEEILIIGSLLEKEGLDKEDKKKIFSVIINRLNKNMKLQIDATVIFSITKGLRKLNRKITFDDLNIKDNYNTYYIYGLPPQPISYVGYKTIELIFENYKTDYLFYFYNSYEKKHIFSLNYKDHLKRLHEYRAK